MAKEDKKLTPESPVSFDGRYLKMLIGATIEKVIKPNLEQKLQALWDNTSNKQTLEFLKFTSTFFPKEIVVSNTDPWEEWSEEELVRFQNGGEKPEGKVIYVSGK